MKLCLRLVLLLLCMAQTSALLAASCTAVFPGVTTSNSSARLDLSGIAWQSAPPLGAEHRRLDSGDHYFGGGIAPNNWTLIANGGASTRVFVNGSLTLENNSLLNADGNPQDLVLVVNGSLTLGNNVEISGFVYVTGSVQHGQNMVLNGAITSVGAATSPGGGSLSLTYAGASVPMTDFAGMCSGGLRPVLTWSTDETSWTGAAGEVLDGTGNGLHGAAFNGAVTGQQSPALPSIGNQGTCGYGNFSNASQQYLQRAHHSRLTLQSSFTIGLWVRPNSRPGSGLMSILSKDENYEFHLNPNGTINWWWQTTAGATREFNSSSALPVGQWSHVLIRFAPGDQRIYINGNLAGQASFSGTPMANTDPLQLGQDQGAAGRYFNGSLDELRIYDRALSTSEISALVNERHACGAELQCLSDDFSAGSLSNDWAVTSRSGSFGNPRIVNGRLRLTNNTGNVATAATLQRLLPAAGNYVQVQFKYYAYNGSGADGVAVILSDSAQTPQPGGYGGSLGYAQLSATGTSGFAGGWLGIALDEYGNFSNPTEGRLGGPGFRPDSVSMRGSGSGTGGYRYLAGTPANLSPGVDSAASSSPAPGHIYRITVDGRNSGEAVVTVERDTGSGFVTLSGLDAVNVLSAAGQAALPGNFFLSFTGSTGGSNNIHELDDLQVCAAEMLPVGQQIDHFEFSYAPNALTCNPHPVTIRACLDPACSSLYLDPVAITLSPSGGWTASSPATISGGNVLGFSGGTAIARLSVPNPGTVSLGVLSSVPAAKPLSSNTCSTNGCQIAYADSGLLLQVPNLLAAKPTAASISAVRKADNALACVPAFANVQRSVVFTSAYASPATGTQPVVVNGSNVTTSPTSIDLSFDGNGTAPLTVRYGDAGSMLLSASYSGSEGTGDSGVALTGSDGFISKPYGFCLETDSTCSVAGVSDDCPLFPGGVRAGDSFPLRIRAVAWEADGEASTAAALCTDNPTTPNFQLGDIALSSALVAPSPGSAGSTSPSIYSHALGNQTIVSASVSEVGVFRLTVTPTNNSYFGETVGGGESGLIGRFAPAFLAVSGNASLTPSCGSFSYQGQPILFAAGREPLLTVEGRNRAGAVTQNYDRGAFWRLAAPEEGIYESDTGVAALDAEERLSDSGTASLVTLGADDGDGARRYRWEGQTLSYTAASVPTASELPFIAEVRQSFTAASLTDDDAVCLSSSGACEGFSYDFSDAPGTEVRLGRLRIGNAHGSELQSLSLPLTLETWQGAGGGSFQVEGLDTCTDASVLGTPALDLYTGNLAEGETTATLSGPTAGIGSLLLSAPGTGNDGSVRVAFTSTPAWLQYPWDGTNRQMARGLASFGIYRGAQPLIFRRELYR